MHHILIPLDGACMSLYLVGTCMMLIAFVLDKMNARKHGKLATGLFCYGFLFMIVSSLFAIIALVARFSNGGI